MKDVATVAVVFRYLVGMMLNLGTIRLGSHGDVLLGGRRQNLLAETPRAKPQSTPETRE